LEQYNPAFSGEIRVPVTSLEPMEMSERKIIARRAAMELIPNAIVNLGIGMPEGVAAVAAEERVIDLMTLTAEPGVIGGIPQGGLNFGAAINTAAIVDQPSQFDFYDGGGLDIAFLGLAQADAQGNLNVSKFGPKLTGAGGFINISQNAKKVVFVGTFTAGGLEVALEDGKLKILVEGKAIKFVQEVEHRTFSGQEAVRRKQPVLYVTERCVFELTAAGVELIEVAPGIDIERDILAHMQYTPIIRGTTRPMDPRIFRDEPMGLRSSIVAAPLESRFHYDAAQNIFFIDFENLRLHHVEEIDEIRSLVTGILDPVGHKVPTVVNYHGFDIREELIEPYANMIKELMETHYSQVTRYATNTFLRAKLGDALNARHLQPKIFNSEEEARAGLGGKV
jgi:propionate CoA-transferase